MARREARRIYRELTVEERARIGELRRKVETEEKEAILAMAKQFRDAKRRGSAALDKTLQLLKTERLAQGLSLSDVAERTGIAKSNLSKLENAEEPNPTIVTLSTYAEALGKRLFIVLADK